MKMRQVLERTPEREFPAGLSKRGDTMDLHVNGWSTIAEFLELRKKTQSDLAVLLDISPAAISQVKSGRYLLSPGQLAAIAEFLAFDATAVDRFYTELFNARLLVRRGVHEPTFTTARPRFKVEMNREGGTADFCGSPGPVPVGRLGQFESYEPALEPVDEYLRRNSVERYQGECRGNHLCVLRLETANPFGLFPDTLVIFEGRRFAAAGDLVLLRLDGAGIMIREYVPEGELVLLRAITPGNEDLRWRRREHPGALRWMYPVVELVLKMPR